MNKREVKRIFIMVLFAFLLSLSSAQAYIVPISLRMGGINSNLYSLIPDEYTDLFYYPASINTIDSDLIFTKLSNLSSGIERLFSYSDDNHYFLGIKRKGIFFLTSFYFDKTVYEPEETYISSTTGVNPEIKRTYYKSKYYVAKDFSFVLVKKIGKSKAIGCYYVYSGETSYNKEVPSQILLVIPGSTNLSFPYSKFYPEMYEEIDTPTNRVLYKEFADGYTETKNSEHNLSIKYSGMKKRDKKRSYMNYELNLALLSNPDQTQEVYGRYTEDSGSQTISDTKSQTSVSDLRFKMGGGISGRLEKMISENLNRYIAYQLNFYFTPINKKITLEFTGNQSSELSIKGSNISTTASVGYVYNFKISKDINLFAGIKEEIFYDKTTYETNLTQGNITTKYGDVKVSSLYLFTNLPVGIEVSLLKKLTLYMGNNFSLRYQISSTAKNDVLNNIENQTKENDYNSSTNFYYGLTYKISENASLNILNFYKLTDLSNWYVGVDLRLNEKVLDSLFKKKKRVRKKSRIVRKKKSEESASEKAPSLMMVKFDNMKLKSAPNYKAETVKVMKKGEMYQVLEDSGRWLKVLSMEDGVEGWGLKVFFQPAE